MSLTWHIVRKDLFRLRWVIALWVVTMVMQMVLATIEAALDMDGHLPFSMAAWAFGNVFMPVLGFGLVMGLQDDDPVTQSDAFWMTRPIAGGRLLCAKALALAFLWLVPALVAVPFWMSHDFGLHLLGPCALHLVWTQVVLTALAVPFAVISENGSRFVMNVMLGIISFLILGTLYWLFDVAGNSPVTEASLISKEWIVVLIWLAASILMAFNQYVRRRTRISLVIMGIAAATGFAVCRGWSGSFAQAPAAVPGGGAVPSQDVTELAAKEGSRVTRDGRSLKIVSIIANDPRGVVLELSESEPDVTSGFPQRLQPQRPSNEEHYVLSNGDDGRTMTAEVVRYPDELHVASLRYFRTTLTFNPYDKLAGNVPANMASWTDRAGLSKVVFRETGPSARTVP